MPNPQHVIIVGGGFSGLMTAYHLLNMQKTETRVSIVEKDHALGLGLAYSTTLQNHLLNVPASNMSALPEEPAHFVSWLKSQGLFSRESDFLPRPVYGRYLQDFDFELRKNHSSKYTVLQDEVISAKWLSNSGWELQLKTVKTLNSDALVLATGHLPIDQDSWISLKNSSPRFISNLYSEAQLKFINSNSEVLIIGTGLSMVDAVLALKNYGHKGPITAFSRRGLLPTGHRPKDYDFTVDAQALLALSQRDLIRQVRQWIQSSLRANHNWRPILDSLRPYTNKIWQNRTDIEKRRFQRHLRPYWEVHRHRMALEVEEEIQSCLKERHLQILKGRLKNVVQNSDGFTVEIKTATESLKLNPHYIVDCRGPSYWDSLQNPTLLQNLLDQQILNKNPLGLGLQISSSYKDSELKNKFYLLGALRRGELFETTAVPELRLQAHEVAKSILKA